MKMNRQPSPTPRAHRPPPPVTSPGYLLSLPPPPSQWISPAPRPHLLRCSRRHLAPTYSAAPADASPPPSPQLPPAPGSPCGGCLPSANRPPPASDSSGIAPPPPSGCPRRRSSRHSASSPVGGPSPIRPAVQTHRPRPFTFATPLFSSHREFNRGAGFSSTVTSQGLFLFLFVLLGRQVAASSFCRPCPIPPFPQRPGHSLPVPQSVHCRQPRPFNDVATRQVISSNLTQKLLAWHSSSYFPKTSTGYTLFIAFVIERLHPYLQKLITMRKSFNTSQRGG
ncbi:extensin isoform X7 [Triticum aestivum]|uniref:extensin isoform X7 n=1 Tax=Triticum aestivum TaxID=4565 RepID=UPI001D028BBA|nr:extensin-like isoform X7 [Triticum aestivum]